MGKDKKKRKAQRDEAKAAKGVDLAAGNTRRAERTKRRRDLVAKHPPAIERTESFSKDFAAATEEQRSSVEEALTLLSQHGYLYASLKMKRMKNYPESKGEVFEIRASRSIRIFFRRLDEANTAKVFRIHLFHEDVKRIP